MTLDAPCLSPAALASQLAAFGENSIMCVHQAELEYPGALAPGVLLLLGRIKLLHPLTRRIPRCYEHNCPLTTRCPYTRDFEDKDGRGKGGRKFQLTTESRAFIRRPELLAECLPQHPAAQWLGQRFAERRIWSCFELAERWLTDALAVVDRAAAPVSGTDKTPTQPDFEGSRRELAACLAILVGLGWLRWEQDGRALQLIRPWW